MLFNTHNEKGLIALITVMIISIVALFAALSVNLSSISGAQVGLKHQKTSEALFLASACAEHALLQLRNNFNNYSGNEVLNIDGESCTIEAVDTGVSSRVVKALAAVENKTRKIKIEVSRPDGELIIESWQEVADF